MTTQKLIEQLKTKGGAIVTSDQCSVMEVTDAQATHRFAVDDEGIGYVRRYPEWLAIHKDCVHRAPNDLKISDAEGTAQSLPSQGVCRARSVRCIAWLGIAADLWTVWYSEVGATENTQQTADRIVALWKSTPELQRPKEVVVDGGKSVHMVLLLRAAGVKVRCASLPATHHELLMSEKIAALPELLAHADDGHRAALKPEFPSSGINNVPFGNTPESGEGLESDKTSAGGINIHEDKEVMNRLLRVIEDAVSSLCGHIRKKL